MLAPVLVQNGTLNVGDMIIAGTAFGSGSGYDGRLKEQRTIKSRSFDSGGSARFFRSPTSRKRYIYFVVRR